MRKKTVEKFRARLLTFDQDEYPAMYAAISRIVEKHTK